MKKIVLLFSGGPDSTTALWHYLKQGMDVHCLTFSTAERSNEVAVAKEIARELGVKHVIVDMTAINPVFSDVYQMQLAAGGDAGDCLEGVMPPAKPAPLSVEIMHMIAAMYAISHHISDVVWAIHADEIRNQKKTDRYIEFLEQLISVNTGATVNLEMPFRHFTKVRVMELGEELNAPLNITWSCAAKDTETPCGHCAQCQRRINAEKELASRKLSLALV